jgi:hypothetical protein
MRRRIDLGAEHQDAPLEEQRVQLLITRPIDERLRWQEARGGRPKAAWLRQVERHLRPAAPLSDTQAAVPVPAGLPVRQLLRQCPPQLRQHDWW